jgi:hypothetical protein
MIDVAGGGSRTRSLAAALTGGADVRVTVIDSRPDRVAVVDPFAVAAHEEYWPQVKTADSIWLEQIRQFPAVMVGDANTSGEIDIADIVYIINHISLDGPLPLPLFSGDVNCSGDVDFEDFAYLVEFVLSGGNAPCGGDRYD